MKKVILTIAIGIINSVYGGNVINKIDAPCNKAISTYTNINNIRISNYYEAIGSLNIDKNILLVLSPAYQQNSKLNQCGKQDQDRLLVLINNEKKLVINKTAILNNIDYQQDPFQRIQKEKNGFSLNFEFGSIIMCNYVFKFIDKNNDYIFDSESHQCFNKGNPDLYEVKSNTFLEHHILLADFNITKYIQIPNLLTKSKEQKSFVIVNKSPLYKSSSESTITKMYLLEGDKVKLLDKETDDAGQEWYYIRYQGKKEIKAWIKAEAVK